MTLKYVTIKSYLSKVLFAKTTNYMHVHSVDGAQQHRNVLQATKQVHMIVSAFMHGNLGHAWVCLLVVDVM